MFGSIDTTTWQAIVTDRIDRHQVLEHNFEGETTRRADATLMKTHRLCLWLAFEGPQATGVKPTLRRFME